MSWTFDAPTGTYRNHALSTDIRREAIADVQFMRFMRPEPGFGKRKGESVTITRIMSLPLAERVSETAGGLPSGRPAIETKTVGVSQWGFKIPMTEFEQHLTHFNILDPFQAALRDQISLTMDVMCADALKLTPLRYTPLTTGGEFVTTGTPVSTADRNWEVQDLRRIHDRLRGLKCPKFKNGKYVGILSTRAARGIKNDPEYKEWIAPTSSAPLMTGALKDIEGFALFESNHDDALADLIGSSTNVGEAVFFGADAGGLVRIMDPEIRAGIPQELGTIREVGWVGTIEAFLTWERPAQARVILGDSV